MTWYDYELFPCRPEIQWTNPVLLLCQPPRTPLRWPYPPGLSSSQSAGFALVSTNTEEGKHNKWILMKLILSLCFAYIRVCVCVCANKLLQEPPPKIFFISIPLTRLPRLNSEAAMGYPEGNGLLSTISQVNFKARGYPNQSGRYGENHSS